MLTRSTELWQSATPGTPTVGTIKVGRDIGIFGAEAILYDATIFGAGTPQANYAPGNTTLGRIGIGYVYADWIPQFSYTTPDLNGFTASVGIFTPLNDEIGRASCRERV